MRHKISIFLTAMFLLSGCSENHSPAHERDLPPQPTTTASIQSNPANLSLKNISPQQLWQIVDTWMDSHPEYNDLDPDATNDLMSKVRDITNAQPNIPVVRALDLADRMRRIQNYNAQPPASRYAGVYDNTADSHGPTPSYAESSTTTSRSRSALSQTMTDADSYYGYRNRDNDSARNSASSDDYTSFGDSYGNRSAQSDTRPTTYLGYDGRRMNRAVDVGNGFVKDMDTGSVRHTYDRGDGVRVEQRRPIDAYNDMGRALDQNSD